MEANSDLLKLRTESAGSIQTRESAWYQQRLLMPAIVLVGAFLRLVQLGEVPPGLFIDEAWSSYSPYIFFDGGDPTRWPIAVAANELVTGQMFTYALAGDSVFWTRFPTAILGIAMLPLIYALVNLWFGRRLAVLSALGLAVAPWALQFSRYAVPGVATALWLLLVLFSMEKLMATRTGGWLNVVTLSILAAFSTHTITKIFLPLFLIGYFILRWHEVKLVVRELLGRIVLAVLTVVVYVMGQVMTLFAGGKGFAIQASLLSNMAFAREGVTVEDVVGVAGRYVQHWDPRFLFITGDPNPLYGTGAGGVLGVLGVFVYVGLWSVWRNRRHPIAKTLLLGAILWPLPSALVLPDNPNSGRGTFGLALLVVLGAIGLDLSIRWVLKRRVGLASASRSSAIVGAVIVISGVLTSSYYFLVWPDRPGLAAEFNYGYAQAADILDQLPRRPVVISDVWRAQDLLAFYGLDWGRIESVTPGQRINRDSFVGKMPAYLLTDRRQDLARTLRFGYRAEVLEVIKTPLGENRFWLARITDEKRIEPADVSALDFSPPLPRYPDVLWEGASGRLVLSSEQRGDMERAVAYAVSRDPLTATMSLTAQVPARKAARSDLLIGFSSYRDPSFGSPDGISPFIATYIKLSVGRGGSYRMTAHSHSVDDRTLDFELGDERGPIKLRVEYRYLHGFQNRFQVHRDGRWSSPVEASNYLKRPLYPFVGLLSDEASRATVILERLDTTGAKRPAS